MAGSGGILCVSVIEAKNVLAADTTSDLSFYVRLRLGHSEVKTDTCLHNIAPKFLKDVRLPVPSPATDVLRMELLQLGPRGDLVVGSADLLVSALVSRGTVVHWFDMKAFNQGVGAQLCCVLRFLAANSSRPVTPSYAIATREARERAVIQAAPGTLQAPGPAATRSLFSDADPASSAPDTKASPAAPEAVAWAPATPAVTIAAPRASRSGTSHDSPTQSTPPGTAAPAAAATPTSSADASASSSGSGAVPAAVAPAAAAVSVANGHASQRANAKDVGSLLSRIPLPLATAGGLLLGVVVYVLRSKRPERAESCDYDEVSLVSSCFNKSSYERYRQRKSGASAR